MGSTLEKLLNRLVVTIIRTPLYVLSIPVFYLSAWLVAVFFPPVCAWVAIQQARENKEPGHKIEFFVDFLFPSIAIPIVAIGLAAPLRAILLAVLSFFPEGIGGFNSLHDILYEPFIPVFGDLFPYWLDVYWGILGLLTILLIALYDSMRRNHLVRQIEILPTAKVRSVAIGLAELKGKAVPLKGKSAQAPIMRAWTESTEDGETTKTHIDPFYLDDGTGRILVDPRGVSIKAEGELFDIGLHQAILKQFTQIRGRPEMRLMPGNTVYLTGNVQINESRADDEGDEIVVKPRKPSWLSPNFYDLFFISNTSEEAALDGFRKSVKWGWGKVLIGMVLAGWLSIFALTNVMQFESSRLDSAPEYFRFVSTPTTLEREISVSKLGEHPTIYFVDLLNEGDSAKTDAIMTQFRLLHLESLALPILKDQAMDIDHPGFGIANKWLSRLGKSPQGHLGFEFFDDSYMNEAEAVVLRLLTQFQNNRLFVSYRAYVGEEREKERNYIRGREVVIELASKEIGTKNAATFDADIGLNTADGIEAFRFLYPGEYKLDVYLKTYYLSDIYDRGPRRRSRMKIRLEE